MAEEKVLLKAQAILSVLDNRDAELSIVIVDDEEMAALNLQFLGRQGPTNVIAFPMQEGEFSHINPGLLGDVVISADTTEREGAADGMGFNARFDQLLVHGILHLLGYDHENSEEEAERMEAKSEAVLKAIAEI